MTPDLSIITTCKGRLHHLRRALPFMLDQKTDANYDVIVVDYGCPDGTLDWCARQEDPRLKCVGVNANVEEFNLNRARNIGAKFSMAPLLMFADCDLLLGPGHIQDGIETQSGMVHYFVESEATGVGPFYWHKPTWDPYTRCVARIYPRDVFESLRGYDEGFCGWGWDDADLTLRAKGIGKVAFPVPARVTFLNHSAEESVRFYSQKDKQASAAANEVRMYSSREVNPGRWGIAGDDLRIHSHDAHWRNPNFIDIATEDNLGGRGDCQPGWHAMAGRMFQGASILDVGSGLGMSKSRMEQNGNSVTLYEPCDGCPSDLRGELADIPDGSFDVVTAFDVIEHVVRDQEFVSHLKRIARKQVLVTTPNFRVSRCVNWFHAREYSPRQLHDLVGGECLVSDARCGSTHRRLSATDFYNSTSPVMANLWAKGAV